MAATPHHSGVSARVLKHKIPDGSSHFDLLVLWRAPQGPDDRCALAWRVSERPDHMEPGAAITAEPLPPHRAHYLQISERTALSNDRGVVTPLADGIVAFEGSAEAAAAEAATAAAAAAAAPEPPQLPLALHIRWANGPTRHYRIGAREAVHCIECVNTSAPKSGPTSTPQ